ncbi:phospholipase D-like domain-containing protein [Peijinzhouia sedimentorum]
MEQFLTGDIWKEVNKLLTKRQKKIACIAYVTSDKLELTKGDTLICDASTFAIKFGETSAKTLEIFLNRGVKVFSNQQLHSKILLVDTFLVIGSANLSKSSAERLTESSIITDSDVLISQAKAFCHNLIEESTLLSEKDIQTLLKIEVVKRPVKPTTNSKIRQKKFGNQYWFVSAFPLKERTYDKIKDNVEKTTTSISKKTKIDEDDISFLRWKAKTKFCETAKEGDQIILRLNNADKTRSFIYPPSTILKKQVVDGFTYFYHDNRGSEESKISWTKFQAYLKTIVLEKNISTRSKTILKNDVMKLKPIWKK